MRVEPDTRRGVGRWNRRKFLGTVVKAGLGTIVTGAGYGVLEAKWCRVVRVTLGIPNLPRAFVGSTLAFLSDVHHGPFVPLGYIRDVVATVNALKPEVVALGGDYVHQHRKYIAPGIAELGRLEAKLGRFAVLGNHDHWEGPEETRAALADAGIDVVTNAGVWLERAGQRLRIGGVGDLWEDTQDVAAALGSATEGDAVILLSHNPDFVEDLRDRRVGLVLSGHTHGGQAVLPGYG